jgi:hypothetical protein
MTKPFATDPDIAAELDRTAKRLREERRIRERAFLAPRRASDPVRHLAVLLPRQRRPR